MPLCLPKSMIVSLAARVSVWPFLVMGFGWFTGKMRLVEEGSLLLGLKDDEDDEIVKVVVMGKVGVAG